MLPRAPRSWQLDREPFIRVALLFWLLIFSAILPCCAQQLAVSEALSSSRLAPATPVLATPPAPSPIQDNSFLIEEAYNQEYGVVQHISALTHSWNSEDWVYTFTQEWPAGRHFRHQFSYTLAAIRAGAFPSTGAGFGDLALNYRYQLLGNGDTRVAFAPRISMLIPSGNPELGRGSGGYGVQMNLPLSVVLNKRWVTHWNVGTTVIPSAQNSGGHRAPASGYNLGQSTIWLARARFNVLLETLWTGVETVVGAGKTQRSHSLNVSPGIRWAFNLSNGMQVVPGIGVPIGIGPGTGDQSIFLYLSIEHPFTKARRE